MERRWNARKEFNSTVMVYQERAGIIRVSVKNVSADGMLMETGRSVLSKGALVELTGETLRKHGNKMTRLKGLIVHAKDGLAGLMFVGDTTGVIALLTDFRTMPEPNSWLRQAV
jgi:hypothetical protein